MKWIAALIILCQTAVSEVNDMNTKNAIGTVTMNDDKSITLDLRARSNDGAIGQAQFIIKPGEKDYNETIKRLNGLSPGEEKLLYE